MPRYQYFAFSKGAFNSSLGHQRLGRPPSLLGYMRLLCCPRWTLVCLANRNLAVSIVCLLFLKQGNFNFDSEQVVLFGSFMRHLSQVVIWVPISYDLNIKDQGKGPVLYMGTWQRHWRFPPHSLGPGPISKGETNSKILLDSLMNFQPVSKICNFWLIHLREKF